MMTRPRPHALLLAVTALATAPPLAAQAPVVTSADWLAAHRSDPDVVILHAGRQKADYDAGHVPGARWIDWAAYAPSADGLSVQLPPPDQLRQALAAAGVRDDSHIIVTGGAIQVTGRLFYTLEYFGFAGRVSLLDGGLAAWKAAGQPVDTSPGAGAASGANAGTARGSVALHPVPTKQVGAVALLADTAARGVSILDARLPEFYTGSSAGGQPRAGHIPGARNIPYNSTLGADGRFLGREALQGIFDAAGVPRGNRVVTYCHIGMQASALYVAARLLGYDAAVYDGSWEEWSRKADYPAAVRPTP
ncbi:MAG: rhodanese-like domain-containing protein [Gemmatimonadota bacterium]|nr:rhodanese-like domain-containing protein [Gemmatimonadota bacterium]